eukprot:360252-Chlamydomonas_euryale.AAC.5
MMTSRPASAKRRAIARPTTPARQWVSGSQRAGGYGSHACAIQCMRRSVRGVMDIYEYMWI